MGLVIWGLINGIGNPASELTVPELLVSAKVLVAVSITWIFSTTSIKLAVLTLCMRIFTTAIFKRWATSLMAVDVCFGITFLAVFITRCSPVSQEWDPVPWGWCRSVTLTELSSISVNLVLDTSIVFLPMPWLWNLRMPLSNKIVVTVMFSFGFATIAIMGYRLEQTVHSHSDPLLAIARVGLLSNLELWLGIIVACLPTMAPFVREYIQPRLSTLSRRLYGSAGPSIREGPPIVQLGTFGRSSATGPKSHNNYSELSESFIDPAGYCDEERLVTNKTRKIHTNSVLINNNTPLGSNQI
ncbi:hypothetical protein ANO14919_075510 [Xylariales sp. No.14919]|nr:hypothetical protein ANO14919_075510 [Xylariales sp. No.14919]